MYNKYPEGTFRLAPSFVAQFAGRRAPFGFNGLGELVYYRTYSRVKVDGRRERWFETVERGVNGTLSMQKRWAGEMTLGWDEAWAQAEGQELFRRIFDMKMLPPGRGLWCMGTAVTEERGLHAALNNCAFVSTDSVGSDLTEAFCFTMDASMLGVGVGFDTAGAGLVTLRSPSDTLPASVFVVPDSREGWVDSLRALLESYSSASSSASSSSASSSSASSSSASSSARVTFDYSKVRPEGAPIRGFGGVSSGSAPLCALHDSVRAVLDGLDGRPLSVTAIVDIMNLIGRCVVSGNVRRTAEIAFGDAESLEYIELKNYKVNPHRESFGWTSNNSVFARLGMNYGVVAERVRDNGEPGLAWLDNMRGFGRMNGVRDARDWRAGGGNPCLEQTLESHELCCLVETFPHHHADLADYERTLESAFMYAKTVTLGRTHWPKSNRVMLRNRRIGTSMSGVAQFVAARGLDELREWCEAGYATVQRADEQLSERFAVPRSIKTTCVKPSGTVSLLAGATPGMHAPESRFYIRRVRVSKGSELIAPLQRAGYQVEPDVVDQNAMVVAIPVDAGAGVRSQRDLSMWEQLALAAFLQKHWADNQVSCTVTFDPVSEGPHLERALEVFQYQLKGISFLPRIKQGAYAQMPYEEISEHRFRELSKGLATLDLTHLSAPLDTGPLGSMPDSFCDSHICAAGG